MGWEQFASRVGYLGSRLKGVLVRRYLPKDLVRIDRAVQEMKAWEGWRHFDDCGFGEEMFGRIAVELEELVGVFTEPVKPEDGPVDVAFEPEYELRADGAVNVQDGERSYGVEWWYLE